MYIATQNSIDFQSRVSRRASMVDVGASMTEVLSPHEAVLPPRCAEQVQEAGESPAAEPQGLMAEAR